MAGCAGKAQLLSDQLMNVEPRQKDVSAFVGQSHLSLPKRRATAGGGSEKRHSYKPLPAQFQCDGFTFRQVVDSVRAYLTSEMANGGGA
jgi:hypothetical protein